MTGANLQSGDRGDLRPIPDPTELTTAAILRELAALREVLEAQITGQREFFVARIDGMDKAISLLQVITDRQPSDVDKKITNLQRLHEEKFGSVQVQFQERDVRVEQTAKDTKTAVDAALAAQEKSAGKQADSFALSIGKSETATTKQIDQLGVLIQQSTKASDEKISDMKDRLIRVEGGRGNFATIAISFMGLVIAAVTAAIVIFRSHG